MLSYRFVHAAMLIGTMLLLLVRSVDAGETKPKATPARPKVTMLSGGADGDLKVLRQTLAKLPGVSFKADEIKFGDFKRDGGLVTSFFTLDIADIAKADIGAIAKAVAGANTSRKDVVPSALFLVLKYRPDSVRTEKLRDILAKVKGVQPAKSWAGDNYIWISVDGAGHARLAEITRALQAASVQFRDPITDIGD